MSKAFKYPKIAPYIPGDHDDDEQEGSTTENEIQKQYESSLLNQELKIAEGRFLANELDVIKKSFKSHAKDGVIGKTKLFQFLNVNNIADTFL